MRFLDIFPWKPRVPRPDQTTQGSKGAFASAMQAMTKAYEFIERIIKVPIHKFTDYKSYLEAGSKKVWASFRACHITACTIVKTKFVVKAKANSSADIKLDPDLQRLLTQPNEFDTMEDLLYQWTFHMKLCGCAYWVRDNPNLLGQPENIYPLLPQFVSPVPDAQRRIGSFEYRVNGKVIIFQPEEIIYFRRPSPRDNIVGMGDIEAAEPLFNDAINRAVYAEKFMENGAQPSGVLTKDEEIKDPVVWKQFRDYFRENYGGKQNSGKTLLLNGKFSYHQLGLSGQDMQAIEADKWSVEQIFLAHGVPLSVAGFGAANYACLPAGELVSTPSGPVEIEKLSSGDKILQFDEKVGSVVVAVDAIIPQGTAKVFEIETRGRRLNASDNHPILTVKRNAGTGRMGKRVRCELVWKKAEDIQVGDVVVILEESPDFKCGFPSAISEFVSNESEAAYIIGQYIGDGSGANIDGRKKVGGLNIATHFSEGYQGVVADAVRFGFEQSVSIEKTSIRWNNARLARAFHAAGLGGTSESKRIPGWVFQLSERLRSQVLSGLIDSDGSVDKRGYMTFGVANKALCEDVRHLAISLGLPVTKSCLDDSASNFERRHEAWRFSICYPAALAEKVELRHPRKGCRLSAIAGRNNLRQQGGRFASGKTHKLFNLVLPKGYGIQRVISVNYAGEKQVFDLATSGTHTFIASGVVTHNTSRQDDINFRKYEVVPLIDIMCGKLNAQKGLIKSFNPAWEVTYNLSGLIDVEQVLKDYMPAVAAAAMTRNELREQMGLERADNPLLDEFMSSAQLTPLEMSGLNTVSDAQANAVARQSMLK